MNDIKNVREDLEELKLRAIKHCRDSDYANLYCEEVVEVLFETVEQSINELERLQKKEIYINQFKNSKYVVIQDSVAKGFEFDNIKEAVDKLYSLKGKHEYDIGVLACVGGEQVFMIAERKLDWSDEK